MENFARNLLSKLEAAFEDGETETLTFRSDSGEECFAVKVIHKPTGTECVCDDFDSQIQNKAGALVDLLQRLRDST